MAYQVMQEDIKMLRQKSKIIDIRIELLNSDMVTVDELQGELVDDSYSIDSSSDIRRTYNLTMIVRSKSFLVGQDTKIWLDKYIKVYTGVKNIRTKNMHWYSMGVFLFTDTNYQFNEITSTLSLNCSDLVAKYNGAMDGQLSGMSTMIPVDSDIRTAMVSTVTDLMGISTYQIEDVNKLVPYDLEFSTGAYKWSLLTTLRDLYSGWETFFDVDGILVHQKIPTVVDDNVVLDDEMFQYLSVDESTSTDFSKVRNVTEVWGQSLDADRYSEVVTNTGVQYNVTFTEMDLTDSGLIVNNTKIGIKVSDDSGVNCTIKINDLPPYPVVDENDVPIVQNTMLLGKSYVLKYKNLKFYYMGQWQIHGIVAEMNAEPTEEYKELDRLKYSCDNIKYIINPDSPYSVEKIGIKLNVLSGGEFDNIYTDDLAIQRAQYENWTTTRLVDTLTLQMINIPWLDVNQKIEYTLEKSNETNQYITKKISGSTSKGTISVELIRFYPLYPYVVS